MTVWFVIAVPLAVMLFAVGMERVENRLSHVSVRGEEVEEFLEQAQPEEVKALYGHGIGRALELFRRRRFGGRPGGRFGRNRRSQTRPDDETATSAAVSAQASSGQASSGQASAEQAGPDSTGSAEQRDAG